MRWCYVVGLIFFIFIEFYLFSIYFLYPLLKFYYFYLFILIFFFVRNFFDLIIWWHFISFCLLIIYFYTFGFKLLGLSFYFNLFFLFFLFWGTSFWKNINSIIFNYFKKIFILKQTCINIITHLLYRIFFRINNLPLSQKFFFTSLFLIWCRFQKIQFSMISN